MGLTPSDQDTPILARLTDLRFLQRAGLKAGLPVIEGCMARSVDEANATALLMGVPLLVQRHGVANPHTVCRIRHLEDFPLALRKTLTPEGTVLLRRPPDGPEWIMAGVMRDRFWVVRATGGIRRNDNDFPVDNALWLAPGDSQPPDPIAEGLRSIIHEAGIEEGLIYARGVSSPSGPELEGIYAEPEPTHPLIATAIRAGAEGFTTDKTGVSWNPPLSAAARVWLHSRSGVVEEVEGLDEAGTLPGVCEIHTTVVPGEVLGHVVDEPSRDRLGWVTALGDTAEEALVRAEAAAERIHIHTRPLR